MNPKRSRLSSLLTGLTACALLLAAHPVWAQPRASRIPITVNLDQPGEVTLVIEDAQGKRVRNLISAQPMKAGRHTIYWDGMDDRERDREAAKHSVFHIPGRMVEPGSYTVRGLVHPTIDIIYRMTPYTNGNPPWRTTDHGSQWLTNHSAPSDVVFLPAGVGPIRDGKPTSKGGQLLVCSRVAEGGSGLAWLDRNGNKLWGQHWLGGVWTAASHMAVDHGDHPVEGTYAYAAASWQGDKYNGYKSELRLHKLVTASHHVKAPRDKRFGTGEDRPVLDDLYQIPMLPDAPPMPKGNERQLKAYRSRYSANLTGMTVHNGIVVCAFAKLNMITFIDAHQQKVLGTATVTDPRGMAFDRKGKLYILSADKLLAYTLNPQAPQKLAQPQTRITGLLDPQYVTIADNGDLYISDWGTSHQVKQFNAQGQPLNTFGDPGVPVIGKYNPNHMNHPAGMALDDQNRLWVTENTHIPKRVSIWNLKDRSLAHAFYGPMRYGGSGAVDPKNENRFFYDDDHGGTLVFELDYQTGKSTPLSIAYLDAYNQTGLMGRYTGAAPSYPIYHGDQLYLTDAYNLHTTGRRTATLYRYDKDGIARIVAAAGNVNDAAKQVLPAFLRPELQAQMPDGFKPAPNQNMLYIWSDTNGNEQLDPNEVQFLDPKTHAAKDNNKPSMGTVSIANDLSFTFSYVGDDVVQFVPTSVSSNGVPSYDINQRNVLATGTQPPASSGGNQVLLAKDGWMITTTPLKPFAREGLGGARHGEPMWSYPSLWPGLHASHIAPMPENPGQVIGTTRVVGNVIDAPKPSDAGQLWAINANKGNVYVFTTDGLFVTRLFEDSRRASWNAEKAIPGMNVNHLSLQEECFGPTWTATDSGKVYLQAHFVGNILELQNLDKIKRLPNQSLSITKSQLLAAMQWHVEDEAKRQAAAGQKVTTLNAPILAKSPTLDGKADDWKNAQWVEIDKRKQQVGNWGKKDVTTRASVAIADGKLIAIWQTYDKNLLRNSGESLTNLFKSGGCLDIMISTNTKANPNRRLPVKGDQRLLISQVGKDKTVAVVYEPVAASKELSAEFGSPLRTLKFDRVQVVSDQVTLASQTVKDLKLDKGGTIQQTTYEMSIPLSILNFNPKSGDKLKFDIGILRGDGSQTLQRVYWTNKASGIVSDIPSEAELIPALWGELEIK